MKILYSYLRNYWKLVILALVLAAINQVFSLLDPYIFGKLIDNYATKFHQYSPDDFLRGIALLLGAMVGVAVVCGFGKK
jgi:ATP-binding cassette subfamily B protein